jgi:hypothetical protein
MLAILLDHLGYFFTKMLVIWLSSLSTLSIHDEGYSRKESYVPHSISTLILTFTKGQKAVKINSLKLNEKIM